MEPAALQRFAIDRQRRRPGAFANPLPEERAILADSDKSRYATSLIARQGDRGREAIPDLLRLLNEHATIDPGKHGSADASAAMNAVRNAFRIIGPEAASARGDIEKMLKIPRLARRYNRSDQEEWDVLLIVLGKPVESLTKPQNRSGTEEQYRNRISIKAAKAFDPTRS